MVKYSYGKRISERLRLVRRDDGEVFVAQDFERTNEGLYKHQAMPALVAAADVLNHENIVSIIHPPGEWNPELVWDYCDAGTLENVLTDPHIVGLNNNTRGVGLLPEGFVWHVALSLLRALQWLHEGKRDEYSLATNTPGQLSNKKTRTTTINEPDWLTILHRDIRPANLHLQRSKGTETYPAVKLGGFEKCYVSGTVSSNADTPAVAMKRPDEDRIQFDVLWQRWANWSQNGLSTSPRERPYTEGSELFDLGKILYQMMTGKELPEGDYEECLVCGRRHIVGDGIEQLPPPSPGDKRLTTEECLGLTVNIDEVFAPLLEARAYSFGLCTLVHNLLNQKRKFELRASQVLDRSWDHFGEWVEQYPDGNIFVDVYDDAHRRLANAQRLQAKLILESRGITTED
ncbi:hypothetical protein B0H63DRAFT_450966 [Podospora didyma]|uniref:non-specific serine/threonine protein kinase n=1 Tax=Podospora didyma TaxID=330526 RepID=A0AAE0TW19_9PEZI|nr:hypothetical protein B0H63DRAFT_450966 [Podospora didyma]